MLGLYDILDLFVMYVTIFWAEIWFGRVLLQVLLGLGA